MHATAIDPADFVRRFELFWRSPSPTGLSELLTPDVRLVQPFSPALRGLPAGQRYFGRLLTRLPDLHAEVDRWAATGSHVFIEFRLRTRAVGALLEWAAVDRFTLAGPLANERVSYFDAAAQLGKVALRPRAWWRALRR